MILAGIDEAGYGPVLGPLVSACCAIRTPDGDDPLPCLWTRLSRIASKNRCKQGKKLHINDSKAVYSPSIGLKELERTVLLLAEQAHGFSDCLQTMLANVDAALPEALATYKWYADHLDDRFPLSADPIGLKITANALKIESTRAETSCVHYRAHVLLERQFNDVCEKTKNKASALFSLVARQIDELLRKFADENLTIVCDRQGGRAHYGNLLRLMFEEWSLEIVSETESRSEYRLLQGERAVRIIFCEKAESISMAVAAASMLAKYLREALMHRFNRYWQQHLPTVEPTAGYYNDGLRFLRDIEQVRTSLGVNDFDLIRQR